MYYYLQGTLYVCTGVVFSGLRRKMLYPMVSSTAARTGMKLVKACSYATSLQFLCCCVLRKMIPPHLDVTAALTLPPGLHDFLVNNLDWLLRPSELGAAASGTPQTSSPAKRRLDAAATSSSGAAAREDRTCKLPRLAPLAEGMSDLDDDEDDGDDDDDAHGAVSNAPGRQ